MAKPANRIPSLDGLRAIAIALVLLAHAGTSTGAPAWFRELPVRDVGVRIFFVISGFLITHLLLRERARSGSIPLGSFYVRRAFRILPAAYVYVGVITAACWATLSRADVATSALFVVNYHEGHAWNVGHLWSLSVQEQFYLLWPLLLALLFSRRRAVLVGAIAFGPLFRAGLLFAYSRHHLVPIESVEHWFPSVVDALATGCLLAVVRPSLERYARILEHPLMLLVPAVSLALIHYQVVPGRYTYTLFAVLLVPIVNLGIALTIDHCIRRRYWILNLAPVTWFGTISYSLYLWQQPFLLSTYRVVGTVAWWQRFPGNIVLALAAGTLAYYLVEQPVVRWRDRHAGKPLQPTACSPALQGRITYRPSPSVPATTRAGMPRLPREHAPRRASGHRRGARAQEAAKRRVDSHRGG